MLLNLEINLSLIVIYIVSKGGKTLYSQNQTYPVLLHSKPSAHLGGFLEKIPLLHDCPSVLTSLHFPPSNTRTEQKRPDLHWLS